MQQPGTDAQLQKQHEQQQALEARRQMILGQILDGAARERLDRIGLVRPEQKRSIEDMLISQAQRGVMQRVTEDKIRSLMSSISEEKARSSKVTIQRKQYRSADSDDDSDYDL